MPVAAISLHRCSTAVSSCSICSKPPRYRGSSSATTCVPTHSRRTVNVWQSVRMAKRSEEHTSELQSLMRISYAVFCLNKNTSKNTTHYNLLSFDNTN